MTTQLAEDAEGITARFPVRAELETDLRDLAAAEAQCCSFLEISVQPVGDTIELRVSGPPEARPIIAEMFRAPR